MPHSKRTLSAKARKAISKAQKARWAKYAEGKETIEQKRARWRKAKQAERKAKPAPTGDGKKYPRGFWLNEIYKLLRNGPRRRTEVLEALVKRHPKRRENLFVTFAMMKKKSQLLEKDGIFSMPPGAGTTA